MEWFTVHEKCWGNPPTRAFTRIIRNWKIKICILEGKYFFLVPGKQHLLLHFDNRIGRSLCRKICYKLGLHICMREEAPRRQRQHLLCLDRDLGLRVEKSNSFSGLINIKMQFLIEPAIPFIFAALQLVWMFLHYVWSLVPSLKTGEAVPKTTHKFTQNKHFRLQLENLTKAG